jgi:hypothetical protein
MSIKDDSILKVKAPLGLPPASIVQETRLIEVIEAIHRYEAAGQEVPMAWRVEQLWLDMMLKCINTLSKPKTKFL